MSSESSLPSIAKDLATDAEPAESRAFPFFKRDQGNREIQGRTTAVMDVELLYLKGSVMLVVKLYALMRDPREIVSGIRSSS